MTDNVAEALTATIRRVASEVVQQKLTEFRQQVQEVCLTAVQAAFTRFSESEAFKGALKEHADSGPGMQEEQIRTLIAEEVAKCTDPKAAVEAYLNEHAAELLKHESIKEEIDRQILEKAKELFKRSVFSGSLDIKKAITKVVENALAARGITGEGQANPAEMIKEHLRENLGPVLQETVSGEVRKFLSSEELKELLDSKFRAIDLYLKTDVIPKVVKREIAKALQGA